MEKRERGEHRGETNHGRNRGEMEDGRWETIEAEEKTEPRKGEDAAGEGRGAGSGRNVVGKTEWEETK